MSKPKAIATDAARLRQDEEAIRQANLVRIDTVRVAVEGAIAALNQHVQYCDRGFAVSQAINIDLAVIKIIQDIDALVRLLNSAPQAPASTIRKKRARRWQDRRRSA